MDYTSIIQNWILGNMDDISFDKFSYFCGNYSNKPIRSFADIKSNSSNTKVIGDLFENFCKLYFKNILNMEKVWIYHEIPSEIKTLLNLSKRDMGIDIICIKQNKYYAIQCKYRKRNRPLTGITWKDLSTFYALTSRTGPYHQIIVMTNADYVKRLGKKQDNEFIIAYKKLQNLTLEDWVKMCQGYTSQSSISSFNPTYLGHRLGSQSEPSKESIREKRNKFLDSLVNK